MSTSAFVSTSNRDSKMLGLNEDKVVTRDIVLKPTSTTNNKSINAERSTNTTNRSWRSTGWTPLSYPSLALFQNRADAEPSIATATIAAAAADASTSDSSFPQELEQIQLNPFFPLHRDVILATVRELLILDGALDSSTLEVKNAKENADIKITIANANANSEQKSEEKEKGDNEEEIMQSPTESDVSCGISNRCVDTDITNTPIEPAQEHTSVVQAEAEKIFSNAGENSTDSDKMPSVPVKTSKKRKRSGASNTTSAVNAKGKRVRGKGKNNKIKKPTNKKKNSKKLTEQKTALDTGKILSAKGTGTAVRIGARTLTNHMKKRSKALTILQNDESRNRNIPSSAESLAEILLNSCKLISQQSHDRPVSPPLTTTVMIDSDSDAGSKKCDANANENDQLNETVNENENVNENRIRKVSDATLNDQDDHLIENEDVIVNMRIGDENRHQDPPISAHLAVIAINLTSKTKSVDIESAVKQFVHNQTHQFELVCHSHDHNNDQDQEQDRYHINESLSESSSSFTEDENDMELDEEAMLLDLERTGGLPKLLDLSIIMETQLRQNALAMTKQLSRFIDDRALGEFLGYGYKSLLPMRKKDRVVELISDFMFDVSHAMFAWEQTENDIYGYENHSKRSNDSKNDNDICKTLFDSRALRKIGGFEPTSLLHHALSIKRLRRMGESWASLASTTMGKKMFAQHHNISVKVHVAQMRRDKRMKKNIAMSSSYPPVSTTKLEDNEKTSRSRSCSLSSEDSTETKVMFNPVSDTATSRSCVTPIIPSLIPITITRGVGKSWGILLAREGSMCVVMRVPPHNENQLQRGDLIVSLRNEQNECVNTPTCSHPDSADIHVSPEWFKQAVGIFKESNTLHLEVRRAITSSSSHA
jgi:hypothetical protein